MAALSRELGVGSAVWMGLGSILGTGVFVSLGIVAGVAGNAVVLAVALAAVVATFNGLSSAQLAAAHPVSGGTYEYGYRFVHPSVGFAAGWMFLLAKSASAATAALGCIGYIVHVAGIELDPRVQTGLSVTLVLLITALVAGGVRRSNRANTLVVSLTLISLAAFVVFGALSIPENSSALDWSLQPQSILQATALMFVAYTGYGRIATLGEEVKDPSRTIPRAIITTLVVSMVVYLSVSFVAVSVVGAEAFAATTRGAAAPLEAVARQFNQPSIAKLVAFGAVTAMAGVLLNLVLGLSRVAFAMARRHDLPRALDKVDDKNQSPVRAVWMIGLLVAGLVLLGDVKTTWSFSAFTVLIYYGITNLSALRLPSEHQRYPRLIAWLGLMSCFGLAAFVELRVAAFGLALLAVGFVLRAVLTGRLWSRT